MRTWSLGTGDPLVLSLAADFRLCLPDYVNDHIWELETSGGDPPAISLRTTYGLRARMMRIFPRFIYGGQILSDPRAFSQPVRLRRFFPNSYSLDFSILPGIAVTADYWVPDSHSVAGRLTITNQREDPLSLLLELCGQLVPLDGQSLAPISTHSVNILSGQTADLAPVLFLTGGPQPGPGPYPSLILDLALASSGSRTVTWSLASLATSKESFEVARGIAARPWEAEQARIELVNASQTVEVFTGDLDWDAAFALTQKTAFSLFMGSSTYLPHPSFVITRQPDQGYSPRGDGSDYPHLWSGQPPLEMKTLANLTPGAPRLAEGLLRNYLSIQGKDGFVDWKPGLVGQRGRWLATPLLATLAWQTFQRTGDIEFLREVQPGLEAFLNCWFDANHDRDGDGFPEWDHPQQSGFEDNPAFSLWQAEGQGADITCTESPALGALLCMETLALSRIAETLNLTKNQEQWEKEAGRLRRLVGECWDADASLYHLRDRVSHQCPEGKVLAHQFGSGRLTVHQTFPQPVRLLVRLELEGETTRRPMVSLHGQDGEINQVEHLKQLDFRWGTQLAVATTRELYTSLAEVEISGLENTDQLTVSVMDLSAEEITLFLPLLAGIPSTRRALNIVERALHPAKRFRGRFGIPACEIIPVPARGEGSPVLAQGEAAPDVTSDLVRQAVHIPWNALIGEGMLGYGLRDEAARLTERLMNGVIQNLKDQHGFARAYHATSGMGLGERNPVQGLAPLGLFLDTLGVRLELSRVDRGSTPAPGVSSIARMRVILSGKNPFPWPVTVKYRGLTVTRRAENTEIVFPNGQTVTLDDPTDAQVSVD